MSGSKKHAEARIFAARQAPYARAGLMSLVPVERPGLGTCAMDKHGRLYYDPAFLAAHDIRYNAFVIVHEWVHHHQKHAQRQKSIVQGDPARLKVFRLAVECPTNEVAQSIFAGYCPADAVTSRSLGLPVNLTVEEAFAIKWAEHVQAEQQAEEARKQAEQQRQQQEQEREEEKADDEQEEAGDDGPAEPREGEEGPGEA